MLVRKILETTLTAGNTSVTFTDSDIPNSLIRTYCSDSDLYPISVSLTGTTVTITYEAQSTNKGVALEIVKQGLEIVDNVTSSDTDKALSAKQGKVLKDAIDALGVPALTDLSDINFTSLTNGDMIVYDGTEQEFINQAQPSIPADIDDLDDVVITGVTNGQILKYVSGNWVNSDVTGGVNYNENEVDTGIYWVNGSKVYQKTIDFGALPNNTTKNVAHNISNLGYIIEMKGTAHSTGSGYTIPLEDLDADAGFNGNVRLYANDTYVTIKTKSNQSSYDETYVTLLYTKTS